MEGRTDKELMEMSFEEMDFIANGGELVRILKEQHPRIRWDVEEPSKYLQKTWGRGVMLSGKRIINKKMVRYDYFIPMEMPLEDKLLWGEAIANQINN